MNMLKNQFGPVAIAVAILLIAAYVFFGSGPASDTAVTEESAETAMEEETETPAAPAQTAPKATAPKATAPTPKPAPTPAPAQGGLNGSTFRLTSFNGAVIPSGEYYTVTFSAGNPTFEDGHITAKICNTLKAPYRLKSGVISANLAGNRAFCGEPKNIMELEAALTVLFGSSRMTTQANGFTLSDNVKTMVFTR